MGVSPGLLRRLYATGSLANDGGGFRFMLDNCLADATVTRISRCAVDGVDIPVAALRLELPNGTARSAADVSPGAPAPFPLRESVAVHAQTAPLAAGAHDVELEFEAVPFGLLALRASDAIGSAAAPPGHIPYSHDDTANYGPELAAARRRFVAAFTGAELQHVARYSFDPAVTRGNIENFTGVAQIPIGIAGPLHVEGEHARGDFLIPLATTEGTLVASYSRGMKVLNLAGGVRCTVCGDGMQRAPVFVFDSAREARAFRDWVDAHLAEVQREAEATSHVARLLFIESYLASKFAYLRFNFATGDAAGQNMVGRATFAACQWILSRAPGVRRFYLESNFGTDKKSSQVNVMRTRGKRVTAEATIPADVLRTHLRVDAETLHYHAGVANVGAFIAGTNNNGLHSPNAITALFIATGQDVANVAEGSAAVIYTEVTRAGGLYLSITIPSLIVATHGGGTGLPTQHECLEMLGCVGRGKVNKLAEIVAGTVLAGELSLAAAISSLEWVSAHERYGRKR